MFAKAQLQTLCAYQWHTRRHLWDCAANLSSTEDQANPGYGHGPIHSLFFHLVNTEQAWRAGLQTGLWPPPLAVDSFPDLASLQAHSAQEQAAWQVLLDGLTDAEIEGRYTLSRGPGDSDFIFFV